MARIEIDAYKAKARPPELLREVQAAKQFTITHRNAVADLVPSQAAATADAGAVIDSFLAFLEEHPLEDVPDVRALIEDGRE
jgi:antitoxin (DNA-binding transcriptional repressor) of toxin-antitoxin stability system